VVGGLVKLIALETLSLLLGQSPGDITGAGEGLLLGGAVGAAAWVTHRVGASFWRSAAIGAGTDAAAGSTCLPGISPARACALMALGCSSVKPASAR
jgi:hypothetical protein